ncbi:MAG: hypothetical protein ACREDO_09510 [Methyloceanibacter sp.]
MTSASLLIVLIVGTVVGALIGLAVGSGFEPLYLAILCGFIGTVVAAIVRNVIMTRSGSGPDESRTPLLVIIYSAVASLGGSALALDVAQRSDFESSVWIGTLAGLFSSILLGMLMITYHTNPGEPPKLRSRH